MNVDDIKPLLEQRSQSDTRRHVFGSETHDYKLHQPISLEDLQAFESRHEVKLPDDYREFILRAGNGGAGPYYGLFPLGRFDGTGRGLEQWQPGDGFAGILKEPFPHLEPWNLDSSEFFQPEFSSEDDEENWYFELDEKYWAPTLVNGAFPICHQGCAYRNLLIVSGPERRHVWLDARSGDGGLTPVLGQSGQRLTFLEWYQWWLDSPETFYATQNPFPNNA